MRVWGIGCHARAGQAIVVALEVEGSRSSPSPGREVFRHKSNPKEDWALKLALLASDLDTELRKAPPDVVVVRSMDHTQSRRDQTTRPRYQIEGVVLAIARKWVGTVQASSGREIGDICGANKAAVEAEAKLKFPGTDVDAAAAAIAALVIAS